MSNIIKLKGKTSKGKNRIREHGEHLTGEWRWFDFHIDKDFEIITK